MRILLLCVVLLLSACASNIQSTRIDKTKDLPVGQGVVAVEIINNAEQLGNLHPGWTEVIAVRTDNMEALKQQAREEAQAKAKKKNKAFKEEDVDFEPEVYSLLQNVEGLIDSQIFIGAMPAGEYMIAKLYSFYSDGNMSSWIYMPVFASAGKFEVVAGQLSNLGSLVFQPLLSVKQASFWSSSSSRKAFVTRLPHQPDLKAFIVSHYPNIARSVDFSQQAGWQDDELAEIRMQLSKLARKGAYGNNSVKLKHFAQAAVAAKFGQLRLLDHNNQWQQVDLPTNAQMSAIYEDSQQFAVGGERGQLFVSTDLQQWQALQPLNADQAIVWFGRANDKIVILTSSANAYNLYHTEQLQDKWQQIGSFTKKAPNNWLVQNGGLFPLVTRQGGLRIINDNKIYDYDANTGSWQNKKGQALKRMMQLDSGALVGLEVSQWDGIGDQVISLDDGDSWQSINRSLNLFSYNKADTTLPAILADQRVVTIGKAKGKGEKSASFKLLTNNVEQLGNKKSWQSQGNVRSDCMTLLPTISLDKLFFLCDQGEIISTADLGQNWQVEVAVDIATMQREYDRFIAAMEEEKANNEQTPTTETP